LLKQDTSVAEAKQAISNYKKAVGEPSGLAELMVSIASGRPGLVATSEMTTTITSPHW